MLQTGEALALQPPGYSGVVSGEVVGWRIERGETGLIAVTVKVVDGDCIRDDARWLCGTEEELQACLETFTLSSLLIRRRALRLLPQWPTPKGEIFG